MTVRAEGTNHPLRKTEKADLEKKKDKMDANEKSSSSKDKDNQKDDD